MRGETRAPRLQVLVDGMVLPGVMSAEVDANNHLAADRFRVRLASGAGGLEAADAVGARFEVQVQLGAAGQMQDAGGGSGWTSLVVGEGDSVAFDPLSGVVDVEGRDLSALLIDTRVDETFANRTSSEIVGVLAGRHGLAVEAQATGTLAGRYYQSGTEQLTMGSFSKAMSEWDLLSYLAVREGFDLYMTGRTLRFEPSGGDAGFVLRPSDCVHLELEHALGMERAIEVTVRSWDQGGAQAVVQTVKGGGRGRTWKHAVVKPNLPVGEANRMAGRILSDLLRHRRTVWAVMPGELMLTPRSRVQLTGTGSGWDGDYTVSEVRRSLDVRHGYVQRVGLQQAG